MKASEIKVGQRLAMRRSRYETPTPVEVIAVDYLRRYADVPFTAPDGTEITLRAAPRGAEGYGYGTGNPVTVVKNEGGRIVLAENRDLLGLYDAIIARRKAEAAADRELRAKRGREQAEHLQEAEDLIGSLDDLLPDYIINQYRKGLASHSKRDIDRLIIAARRALANHGVTA